MAALAVEVTAAQAAGSAANDAASETCDAAAKVEEDAPDAVVSTSASEAPAVTRDRDLSSDEDEMHDGSAQRWLSSKLVSPITGAAPAFGAGALARWGERERDGGEEKSKEKKAKKKKRSTAGAYTV